MATPLATRSVDVQNCATCDTTHSKYSRTSGDPPSSPFQQDIDQENQPPANYNSPWTAKIPIQITEDALQNRTIIPHDETMTLDLDLYPPEIDEVRSRTPLEVCQRLNAIESAAPATAKAGGLAGDPDMATTEDDDSETIVSEDTCFSTFSAIPNADMTAFANIGNIETGSSAQLQQDYSTRYDDNLECNSPFGAHQRSPSPSRQASQIPPGINENTTTLLLDFTQQFDGISDFPKTSLSKGSRQSPIRVNTDSTLLTYIQNQRAPSPSKSIPATPRNGHRNLLNLLDFDLPAQPTPRSVPTITAREVETLKSGYLSEIFSLKASLSGREAEVLSLKTAVNDAERRVGEALETLREERTAREYAELDKAEWEKKGRELENLLQSVRVEVVNAETEREDIQRKLDDSRQALDEAQARTEAAQHQAVMSSFAHDGDASGASSANAEAVEALVAQRVGQQLDEKMENLARELHSIYKKKHETKVATLKKTYEARGDKRCNELQSKLDSLTARHEALVAKRHGESALHNDSNSALEVQTSLFNQLKNQIASLQESNTGLEKDLLQERAEKGDLVAAVDEMLALQSDTAQDRNRAPECPTTTNDSFRQSFGVQRAPGLRDPPTSGTQASRLGRITAPGLVKSRMMSSIERMGCGRSAE